jgi:hypothetical protein
MATARTRVRHGVPASGFVRLCVIVVNLSALLPIVVPIWRLPHVRAL